MAPKEARLCFKLQIRERHLQEGVADAFGRNRIMERVNANNIILRDIYDNKWDLKPDNIGNDDNDSNKFIHENMIEAGDVICCRHEGENVFQFYLRDSSNNMKVGVGRSIMDEVEEILDMDAEQPSDKEDDKDSREGEEENEETSEKGTKAGRVCATTKHTKKLHQMNPKDIFTLRGARRPENPYFVTTINRKRVDELFIPKKFHVEIEFELPKITFLTDSNGRGWRTELERWKDGRVVYHGGWENLCAMNNVGESDNCVCEFIRLKDGFHIRVTIIRA